MNNPTADYDGYTVYVVTHMLGNTLFINNGLVSTTIENVINDNISVGDLLGYDGKKYVRFIPDINVNN